ncbi:hypothetical protein HY227_02215 [Candidatus Wolfebacteria bacterium]|nr:hypothetical protein [Candidatus Wolfebacteria bacterium]
MPSKNTDKKINKTGKRNIKVRVSDIVLKSRPINLKKRAALNEWPEEKRGGKPKQATKTKNLKSGKFDDLAEKLPEKIFSAVPIEPPFIHKFENKGKKPETKRGFKKPEIPIDFKKIDEQVEKFEKSESERFTKEAEKQKRKERFRFKTYFLFAFLGIVLAGSIYAAVEFLPKAKIQITAQKFDWHYLNSVTANKGVAGIDPATKQIPAEIFSKRKNFTFSFPASGKKQVEKKASGKVLIYNSFSSAPQSLVAQTRFSSPNGKIYRLEKTTVVPGAKISDGKIVPSSIEATVIAQSSGPDYNITDQGIRFSIPGFEGTPKYKSFYAELKDGIGGGFVGETAYATDADIKKYKEEAEKSIKENIEAFLLQEISSTFKIIDGNRQFTIVKEDIKPDADENGKFPIFIEAESSIITFKESDLLDLMKALANSDLRQRDGFNEANFEIKKQKIDLSAGKFDQGQGKISFGVNFSGDFWQPLRVDDLKNQTAKKNEMELRNLIRSLPGAEKAVISFWPFWVSRVPANLDRVEIEIE